MSDAEFFERPRFWTHLWALVVFPIRWLRHRRLERMLLAQQTAWRLLALSPITPEVRAQVHAESIDYEVVEHPPDRPGGYGKSSN